MVSGDQSQPLPLLVSLSFLVEYFLAVLIRKTLVLHPGFGFLEKEKVFNEITIFILKVSKHLSILHTKVPVFL